MPDNMASTSRNEARDSRTISGESGNQGQPTEPSGHPSTPLTQDQGDDPSDSILAALNRKRRQLQEIAVSDQPMAAERRRQLNQQLKDLKELARHDSELAQLSQDRQNLHKSLTKLQGRRVKQPHRRQNPSNSDSSDTDPSNSDPSDLDGSNSSSSSSDQDTTRHGHRRGRSRRSRGPGVKISEIVKLTSRSTLRQWGDWKDDLERLFRSDPNRYTTSTRKIDKALDFVDSHMRSLWKVEVRRSPDSEAHFKTFVKWARKTINGGTDGAVSLYEKYDEARQLENQSPFEFDAYLTSLEALMEDKGDRGSAMSFFAKLLKQLRDQMKASGDTLPEDRRQMVAKAQRAWEATLKKGRSDRDQLAKRPRQRSRSPRQKSYSHHDYHDRSQSRHRYKDHRHRGSHRDHHKDRHGRKDKDQKDRLEDHTRQDSKDQSSKGRCYSCGEPGHYSTNCPKKQKRVHATRHRSRSKSSSSLSTLSPVKTLSPSPSNSSKN